MNLYLIEQNENQEYDTFDSAVVAAESEDQARDTHPKEWLWGPSPPKVDWLCGDGEKRYDWARHREAVIVTLLGVAKEGTKAGVICSSFNAG